MTKDNKRRIFEPLSRNFETSEFRDYYLDMVAEIPDYIFTMPSSTSGKYHNATQCQAHGQIYHIYMFDAILNHRLRLKHNKEIFDTPTKRDAMRCIPAFHDAVKCGRNGSKHTVQNHPLLAAKWVLETNVEHDISIEYKQIIADMCEAHSGEWNKNKNGVAIMSEPRNEMEFFIHECDILPSRADLDYVVPYELKDLLHRACNYESLKTQIEEYKIPFGKYKGELIIKVAKDDKEYLEWMQHKIVLREPLRTFVEILLK